MIDEGFGDLRREIPTAGIDFHSYITERKSAVHPADDGVSAGVFKISCIARHKIPPIFKTSKLKHWVKTI